MRGQQLLFNPFAEEMRDHITYRNRRHGKFLPVIRSRLEFRRAGLSWEGKAAQVFRQRLRDAG
jgi:hypothetical protein